MRNIIKQISKVSMTFIMMLLTSTPLIASTIDEGGVEKQNFSYSINEYDAVKQEYEEMSLDKNKSRKLFTENPEKYEFLTNYKEYFNDSITQLNTLTDKELKIYDYTSEQIQAIRTFDGSESKMSRASATVSVYGGFQNFKHNKTSSAANMIVAFNWKGAPTGFFDDIFAVTWSYPFKSSNARSSLGYNVSPNFIGKLKNKSTSVKVSASGLYDNEIRFAKYRSFSAGYINSHVISAGTMFIDLSCKGNYSNLGAFAAYGKNTLKASPGVSFPGSVSISFGKGVTRLATSRFYA